MTTPQPQPGQTERWVVLLVALGALALQAAGFWDLRHDDAYITYRYGQNLATGEGLVFNPGERVMASTAPGHALIAAGLFPLAGKSGLPTAMALLGCLGWTLQALAAYVLLRRPLGLLPAAAVAAGLAAGIGRAEQWVALESNLALAAALWAVALALRDRWRGAAACCALAGLLRPDAYLVAALLAPLGWARSRGDRLVPALVFLVPTLAWATFAELYFGTPRPRSALIKMHASDAFAYLRHELLLPARMLIGDGAGAWAAAALWTLAILGAWRLVRAEWRLAVLPLWALGHLAAYLFLRPDPGHTWHLHPSTTLLAVLALSALAAPLFRRARQPGGRVARIASAAVVLIALAAVTWRTARFAGEHAETYHFGGRDTAYRAAAAHIVAHGDPGDLIAGFEIGTLGYWSERTMYDWAGLVTSEPQFPSGLPGERWFVVDDGALHVPAGEGWPEVATFRHGDFTAHVFDRAGGLMPPAAR